MSNAERLSGRPVSEWPPRAEVVLPVLKDGVFAVGDASKRKKVSVDTVVEEEVLTQPAAGTLPWGGDRVGDGGGEVEIHGVDADSHEGEIPTTTISPLGSSWSWNPAITDQIPPTAMLVQAGVPLDECARVLKNFYDRRSGRLVDGQDVPFSLTQTLNEWYEGLTDDGMRWLTTFSTQEEKSTASIFAKSTASISDRPNCPETGNETSPPEEAGVFDPVYSFEGAEEHDTEPRPMSSVEKEHDVWSLGLQYGDSVDVDRLSRNPSR